MDFEIDDAVLTQRAEDMPAWTALEAFYPELAARARAELAEGERIMEAMREENRIGWEAEQATARRLIESALPADEEQESESR